MAYNFNYSKKFETVLQNFILEYKLFPNDRKIAIAVSGGSDSMGLLMALININIKPLVIHFNHQTRGVDNQKDENLIRSFCHNFSLELQVYRLNLDLNSGNFENRARGRRKDIYNSYIKKGFIVLLAHHLDDSFEWTMMQKLKQSTLKSTLGIPLVNHGIVRPFLTFSKKQILYYVKINKVPFLEDKSNSNERFERNYFRKNILPSIKSRYPQYLKHYVSTQTELAEKLNLHRIKSQSVFKIVDKNTHGVVLFSTNFESHKVQLREFIYSYSLKSRGEINDELDKLLQAVKKMNSSRRELKMKGPFSFSGGVKIYVLSNFLFITNQKYLYEYNEYDRVFLNHLKNGTQITCSDKFPFIYLLDKNNKEKSSNLIHPLMAETIFYLKENKIPYSFRPLSDDVYSL